MADDITKLIEQLGGADATERAAAAEALARLETSASEAAVPLVRAAADGDEATHDWAVAALEGVGRPPAGSAAELAKLLADSRPDVAYWAATLLGRLGANAASAVPALAAALKATSGTSVQERAAWALGKVGPPASAAKTALTKAAAVKDQPRLARLAAEALKNIDSSSG
ncbi:MAG: HEAT repeat domain-containing protein [Pirellulales bacterium]|nr:HEAT repeat domain-containing protein [Pirellulales bacterium]